jgi:uncharacterized membrane protein (DUF485 family)
METFLTPTAIFLATCAGFLVGSVWYSPLLFMKAWMKGEGTTKEHMPKRSLRYMIQINLYSFITHGAIATVLAILLQVLSITSLNVAVSLGLLLAFGFIVTTRFIDMIYTISGNHYEARAQIKFLVSSGYYLVVVALMSAVLFVVGA